MKNNVIKTLICAALASLALPAVAARYNFSQDGYSDGGKISGWFEGVDKNSDGVLVSWENEVTDYHLSYSGGSSVAAFTHSFSDFNGLLYLINSPMGSRLGDDGSPWFGGEGIGSNMNGSFGRFLYVAGAAAAGLSGGGGVMDWMTGATSTTNNLIEVAAVPEPETYAMLLAGLGVVGWSLRKRQR